MIETITDNKQFSCLIVQAPEDSKTEHDALKPMPYTSPLEYNKGW